MEDDVEFDDLIVRYTNADVLTNKMQERRMRIDSCQEKPDSLMITEVQPKHYRFETTETELAEITENPPTQ